MDSLADAYEGRVEFLFVYGAEAHPGGRLPPGLPGTRETRRQAATQAERRAAARVFRDALRVRRRVLVDALGEGVRERLLPLKWLFNPVVVVGADGRIVYAARWLDARALADFLKGYLTDGNDGLPARPTRRGS